MINRPKNEQGRFISQNPEPLADKALSVRLPVSIDAVIRQMPSEQRAAWLRSVLSEAVKRELMVDSETVGENDAE